MASQLDLLHGENLAKEREIRRLSKDVKKYEQAIMNLKSEMQLQRDVPKKDVEVMVGMCCSAKSEDGGRSPERTRKILNFKSANEQVRALRKVNLSLSEELHALRRVCAALDEQLRAATTRTALKDDIIREMRRQLKQAKAKEGKKEASVNVPPLLEETLLDTVSSDPFVISVESLEEIENSFFEQLRLNDGLLCPGQPRYEDIAHTSYNSRMAHSIHIDEKTTFIIEPDVAGGESVEEIDYTTFLAEDSGQDNLPGALRGSTKPLEGNPDQFNLQTPTDTETEFESRSPRILNSWAPEELLSSTRQFGNLGPSHTVKHTFRKPDTAAGSPGLGNSQTTNEPPPSFSQPKFGNPASSKSESLNYTFRQPDSESDNPGLMNSQNTDEPSTSHQSSNPGPSNPQTPNESPRKPDLRLPLKTCKCRPLRRTFSCSCKAVSSRSADRSGAGAKYPCSSGKSTTESPRVIDQSIEVNYPCTGSEGPPSSENEEVRPSIAATVAAVVKDIVNKIASNFIGPFSSTPPLIPTPPSKSPRRGVQFTEPHENPRLPFDSEVEELYFNRDLKKSGASVDCDLYEELKSVASLCEEDPTTSSLDKTQAAQDSGQGPCDSIGSDAERAKLYRNKLRATEEVLANKEETLRIQAKSLNLAEERITTLTCRAQQIKRELDRCQAQLNAQRKKQKTNEASTSGATTARPPYCDKCCGTATTPTSEVESQKDMVLTLQNNLSVIEDLYRECFYETAKQEEMIEKLRKSYLDVRLMERRRADQVGKLERIVNKQKCSLDRCQDIAEEVDTLKQEISSFLGSSNNDSGMWEQSVTGDSSGGSGETAEGRELGEGREIGDVREVGQELQEITQLLHSLRDILQEESSVTTRLKKEYEKLKESNSALEGQLRETQEALVVLKEENDEIKESNKALQDQLRQAQEALVVLKDENEKLKESNKNLEDQLLEAQQTVELLKGSLDDKDKVIRLFKDDNDVLCRQVEGLQGELRSAVSGTIELECLRDQLLKGQEVLQEKCAEVCQLKKRCADLEKEKEDLVDKLEKDDNIIKENGRIRSEVHTLSQQVSMWRSQLGDSEERVRRVEAELQNARARARTMDQCYREKAGAAAALQAQLEDAHARGGQLCAEARRVIHTVRGWVQRAQDTNSKQEKVIRKQNAIIESLQQELTKIKDKINKSQEDPCCICPNTSNNNILSPRINNENQTSDTPKCFDKQVFFCGNITSPKHTEIRSKVKITPSERITGPDDNNAYLQDQQYVDSSPRATTCVDYVRQTANDLSKNCSKCSPRRSKVKRKINKSSVSKENVEISTDEQLDCERMVCAVRAMESLQADASETAGVSKAVGVSEIVDTPPAPPRRLLKKQRCFDRIAHVMRRKPECLRDTQVQQPVQSEACTSNCSGHFSPPGIPARSTHTTTHLVEDSTAPSSQPVYCPPNFSADSRYPSRIPIPRAGLPSAEELFERVERLQHALEDGHRRWGGHNPTHTAPHYRRTR